jgi:hypothetical protein
LKPKYYKLLSNFALDMNLRPSIMMLIPSTTPMRVCDIWRGYFAQRLNWDIGGELMFGQEDVRQIRSSHSYLDDFKVGRCRLTPGFAPVHPGGTG